MNCRVCQRPEVIDEISCSQPIPQTKSTKQILFNSLNNNNNHLNKNTNIENKNKNEDENKTKNESNFIIHTSTDEDFAEDYEKFDILIKKKKETRLIIQNIIVKSNLNSKNKENLDNENELFENLNGICLECLELIRIQIQSQTLDFEKDIRIFKSFLEEEQPQQDLNVSFHQSFLSPQQEQERKELENKRKIEIEILEIEEEKLLKQFSENMIEIESIINDHSQWKKSERKVFQEKENHFWDEKLNLEKKIFETKENINEIEETEANTIPELNKLSKSKPLKDLFNIEPDGPVGKISGFSLGPNNFGSSSKIFWEEVNAGIGQVILLLYFLNSHSRHFPRNSPKFSLNLKGVKSEISEYFLKTSESNNSLKNNPHSPLKENNSPKDNFYNKTNSGNEKNERRYPLFGTNDLIFGKPKNSNAWFSGLFKSSINPENNFDKGLVCLLQCVKIISEEFLEIPKLQEIKFWICLGKKFQKNCFFFNLPTEILKIILKYSGLLKFRPQFENLILFPIEGDKIANASIRIQGEFSSQDTWIKAWKLLLYQLGSLIDFVK